MAAPSSQASDIAPYRTEFSTDVVYAGLGGLRGFGAGSITVTGVSGTVTRAELYWNSPTDGTANANANITFAGTSIVGTNIGSSAPNCWQQFVETETYRADVTALVTGNGSYALSDLIKPASDINGVGLIVFFDDGNEANDRDVVLFHGNDADTPNPYDADGWNVSLSGIAYSGGEAWIDLMVADGQVHPDGDLVINGTTLPGVFNGDSVPTSDAGSVATHNGGLWDQKSLDLTPYLSPGTNTVTLTHSVERDCLALVVAAVNVPAGAAPEQPNPPTTPVPSTRPEVPPTTSARPTTSTTQPSRPTTTTTPGRPTTSSPTSTSSPGTPTSRPSPAATPAPPAAAARPISADATYTG